MTGRLVFPLLLLSAFGCAGTEFTEMGGAGGGKDDSKKEGGADSKKDDNDEASEPVSVGGAYLACFMESESKASKNVGCAVRDEKTHQKTDLKKFKFEWSVTKDKQIQKVDIKEGDDTTLYHRLFQLPIASYHAFNIGLNVVGSDGKRVLTYSRDLEKMDPRTTFEIKGFVDLDYKISEFDLEHTPKWRSECLREDNADSSCIDQRNHWAELYGRHDNDFYFDPTEPYVFVPDPATIDNYFGAGSFKGDESSLQFVGGKKPCIVNDANVTPILFGSNTYVLPMFFEPAPGVEKFRLVLVTKKQDKGSFLGSSEMMMLAGSKYFKCW